MLTRPTVLLAHDWPATRAWLAHRLTERWPHLAVHEVAPADLDAALAVHRAPVVVCAVPSPAVQRHARGWVALLPEDANVALVGVGDTWRVVPAPRPEDVVAAIEGLLASAVAPPPASVDAAAAIDVTAQ